MRRLFGIILLVAALLGLPTPAAAAQASDDLKGIWVGKMVSAGSSQEAWLFLGVDATGVKGTITSNMNDDKEEATLEHVVFQDGVLRCDYVDRSPAARGRVVLELKLAQGWLVGTFRDSAGGSGTVQVNRRIAPASAPKPGDDFLGEWTGEMVSGKTRTGARLVLSRGEGGLVGQMTPDVGDLLTDFDLDHIVVKGETIAGDFKDVRTQKPVLVMFELRLTDPATLEGTFRDASGRKGTIALSKVMESTSALR